MSKNEPFSSEIVEKIGFYVYRLIDPRTAETFYVGKGKGNRVFDHAKGEIVQDNSNDNQLSEKLKIIYDIRNADLEVDYIIHRHGMNEETAIEVEAALMDAYPTLSNVQGGHGSSDYGIMHVKQIIKKYKAEVADLSQHSLLMINVNQSVTNENKDLLDAVRFAWVIDKNRAEKAEYVLAVKQGIIEGVFVADKWLDATQENFPTLWREELPKRKGFDGHKVTDPAILDLYKGKSIPAEYRKKGASNPIKYNYE